jgi:SWI/SNF-related matrix-associated actin-dependent regulator of chromatin subfamily A3
VQRVTFFLAHVIRNLSTKQFRAINRISAHIRWCLTGTPIQNSLTDLAALVSFLGVPILKEPAIFRKHIDGATHPSKANTQVDFQNLRLLLGSICLRRPKDILCLFGLTVEERRPKFSAVERQEYNDLLRKSRVALDLALSGHNSNETHQRVIEALLRLRLYCNNGLSPEKGSPSSSSLDSEDVLGFLQQNGEVVCKYCSCDILSLDAVGNPDFVHMTECRLLICCECISQYQEELKRCRKNGEQLCPFCSGKHCMDNLFRKESKVREEELAVGKVYPSKLLALLDDIQMNPLHEKR